MSSPTCSVQLYEADRNTACPPMVDSYCECTYPGTRIGGPCLETSPNCFRSPRDPASKDANLSHLTRTSERRTLSRRQHQSGKLQSLECKGFMRQPPRLVIKGVRTAIWREDYVKASLIVQPRPCRCTWCLRTEGPVYERDRDLCWAARRAEKGKDWKGRTLGGNSTHGEKLPNWADYDWNVERDDVDVDAFWDEAENAFAEEARVMNVDLLDLATKSYTKRKRRLGFHETPRCASLTCLPYRIEIPGKFDAFITLPSF